MAYLLTGPEMDAALQLMQLSGDSAEIGGRASKAAAQISGEAESAADSLEISSVGGVHKSRELEDFPRRKKRFRSIGDVYRVTRPVIETHGKKIST